MHIAILLTRFCKLLTTVTILSGGGASASSASMAQRLALNIVTASIRSNHQLSVCTGLDNVNFDMLVTCYFCDIHLQCIFVIATCAVFIRGNSSGLVEKRA